MSAWRTIDVAPCPKCGARKGEECRTPKGVPRRGYPHKIRYTAALKIRNAL